MGTVSLAKKQLSKRIVGRRSRGSIRGFLNCGSIPKFLNVLLPLALLGVLFAAAPAPAQAQAAGDQGSKAVPAAQRKGQPPPSRTPIRSRREPSAERWLMHRAPSWSEPRSGLRVTISLRLRTP